MKRIGRADAHARLHKDHSPPMPSPGFRSRAIKSTSQRPHMSMEINAAIAPSTTVPTSSSLIMGMRPANQSAHVENDDERK